MKFFKTLLAFILALVIIVVIGGGVVYFLISSPAKTVATEWTSEDFQSYLQKGGIEFTSNHASVEDIFADNVICTEIVPVNAVVTNEELSAVANMSSNNNSFIKDVRIECTDDGDIIASCVIGDTSPLIAQFPELKPYAAGLKLIENKPVYMKSSLYYDKQTQRFEGITEELYVGRIRIPIKQANDSLRPAGDTINNMLKNLDGFSVNEFHLTSEGFVFDGTIPKRIESAGKLLD